MSESIALLDRARVPGLVCPPWCRADHSGDTFTVYTHTHSSPPVEVNRHVPPDVLYVDIEQTERDSAPVLVVHGPHMDYAPLSPREAERFAITALRQVIRATGLSASARKELIRLATRTSKGVTA